MYGSMDYPNSKYPHVYNGPAKNLTVEMYDILKNVCPYLAMESLENTTSCCGLVQLQNLRDQLQTAASLFSRCPSCIKNFYNMWCDFTCSPNQSMFLQYNYDEESPGTMPNSNFYVTKQLANGLYNSCKDVVFPGTNGLVLDFMCGVAAAQCDTTKFLSFIGNPNNAPFNIFFYVDEPAENITSNNLKMIKCSETFFDIGTGKNNSACSCQDCEKSCPTPPSPPAPTKTKYILGIRQFTFYVVVCLLAWFILFLIINVISVIISPSKKLQVTVIEKLLPAHSSNGSLSSKSSDILINQDEKVIKTHKNCIVGIGIYIESQLQHLFRWWGTWCANHPWSIIVASLIVVGICSAGLFKFTVVTNPVELWSAYDSVARIEKNYFDSKFAPFYRTEQIIISNAKYRDPFVHPVYQHGSKNFSGVMYDDILNAVSIIYYYYQNTDKK